MVVEINSLSHLLDVAIKDWGIALPSCPATLVRRPAVARGRERCLLPDEEFKLFAACTRSRAMMPAPVVCFAIETSSLRWLSWKRPGPDDGSIIAPG